MARCSTKTTLGSETSLCDPVVTWVPVWAVVQTHRMGNTKGNPDVNMGSGVVTCQCGFTD